jgi:uncharacterized protein (DUF608 family)
MSNLGQHGFLYKDDDKRNINFPVGGIGAGCIGLSASGRLTDWEIYNRPGKGTFNGLTHFAIKAEKNGELVDARMLHGPYDEGQAIGHYKMRLLQGFGHGTQAGALAGMPHFKENTFEAMFPTAKLSFSNDSFPGEVGLSAFSSFCAQKSEDSSLPAAFYVVSVENNTDEELDYFVTSVIANPSGEEGIHEFHQQENNNVLQLKKGKRSKFIDGDISVGCDGDDVSCQRYLFRGDWFDSLTVYWDEFKRPGNLQDRCYHEDDRTPNKTGLNPFDHGALSAKVTLKPGEKKDIRFAITWHYPEQEIYWRKTPEDHSGKLKNYYGTKSNNSVDVQNFVFKNWQRLEQQTLAFRDSFLKSTLPDPIKDAVTANLALLVTPTIIRLEDGMLWGWEGLNDATGSCEGSCNHVWNYQQALAFIFPDLERSLREGEYKYSMMESGGLSFRQILPLGSGFFDITPCVDGQMGSVIKTYREWKVSGDTTWLAEHWSSVKKIMEYTWSADNPDQWDPTKSGIVSGRQHHTLDMELYSPNSWLNSFYLTALKAMSEMSDAMDDAALSQQCQNLYIKGRKWCEEHLFNGEYFTQKIDISDKALVDRFAHLEHVVFNGDGEFFGTPINEVYWSKEHEELIYQIGNGCGIDQILGQWHAYVTGLGDVLDSDKVDKALETIYSNNYKPTLWDHANPCRTFAFEDEGGTANFTWPNNDKQSIPIPYAEEIFTGFEYAFASLLIYKGKVEQGLNIVKSARGRYTGKRRNPWSEIECGSNYVRSLSSFSLLTAWTQQVIDSVNHSVSIDLKSGEQTLPWFSGSSWGQIKSSDTEVIISVSDGELKLNSLSLGKELAFSRIELNGQAIPFNVEDKKVVFESSITLTTENVLKIILKN